MIQRIQKDSYTETFYLRLINANNRQAVAGNRISLSNYSKPNRIVTGIEYGQNIGQTFGIPNYAGTGLELIDWTLGGYLFLNLLDKNNNQLVQDAPLTMFSNLGITPGITYSNKGRIRPMLLDVDFSKSYIRVAGGSTSFGNNEMLPLVFHFLDK